MEFSRLKGSHVISRHWLRWINYLLAISLKRCPTTEHSSYEDVYDNHNVMNYVCFELWSKRIMTKNIDWFNVHYVPNTHHYPYSPSTKRDNHLRFLFVWQDLKTAKSRVNWMESKCDSPLHKIYLQVIISQKWLAKLIPVW